MYLCASQQVALTDEARVKIEWILSETAEEVLTILMFNAPPHAPHSLDIFRFDNIFGSIVSPAGSWSAEAVTCLTRADWRLKKSDEPIIIAPSVIGIPTANHHKSSHPVKNLIGGYIRA